MGEPLLDRIRGTRGMAYLLSDLCDFEPLDEELEPSLLAWV